MTKRTKGTKTSDYVDLFSFCKEFFSRIMNDESGVYKTYLSKYKVMSETCDQFLAYKSQLELEIWKNMKALQVFETSPFTESDNGINVMREQLEEIDHDIIKNLQEKASLTKENEELEKQLSQIAKSIHDHIQDAYIEKNIINKRVEIVKSEKQRVKKIFDAYLNKVHVLRKMTLENRKLWRINKTENWDLVLQLRDLKYRYKVIATNA